jgi:hypothetical protein
MLLRFYLVALYTLISSGILLADELKPEKYVVGSYEAVIVEKSKDYSLVYATISGEFQQRQLLFNCKENLITFRDSSEKLTFSKESPVDNILIELCSGYSKVQKTSKINEAKKECQGLGFKAGTEKFGKCVLELSK